MASKNSETPGDRPVVIVEAVKNALRICAVDTNAIALGLVCGMTLADARARVPEISVFNSEPECDLALLERVADWSDRFTPLVAVDKDNGLLLDVTGCAHLFGGEVAMLGDLSSRLEAFGLATRAAIASTPDTARAISRFTGGGVVADGEERQAVSSLPITALNIPTSTAVALSRAGLKRISDIAERPRTPLSARFGAELLDQLDRTLGLIDGRISPRRVAPEIFCERNFHEPISTQDDIERTISGLCQTVSERLEHRGEGGRSFETTLFRVDGAMCRISIGTAGPLRDPKTISVLFHKRLEAVAADLDPGFGFDLVRVAVIQSEKFETSQSSLDASEIEQEDVTATVDQIGARFGERNIRRFLAGNSHIPELSERSVPYISGSSSSAEWPQVKEGEPPSRPLHVFEPPQPIETLAEVPDGPPLRFRWRHVLHEVVHAEGPERIAFEWWKSDEAGLSRDYYRVEDNDGRRYWIFRKGLYERETGNPRWFLHGLFA